MVTEKNIFYLFSISDEWFQLDMLNLFGNTYAAVDYLSY
jgi:hypothetical protein